MGDELHNRVSAGTSIFARIMAPHLVRTGEDRSAVAEVLDYLAEFDIAIVPLTMAGCKAVLDAAHGIEATRLSPRLPATALKSVSGSAAWAIPGLPARPSA